MPYIEHQAGSATGETYTTREREFLARYSANGLMRYKDLEAFACRACGIVYGVTCPNCKESGPKSHDVQSGNTKFIATDRPWTSDYHDSFYWAKVECNNCGFMFKVIAR